MNGGTGNFLLEKAEAFALRIVRLYQHLSEKGERVMSKQVLRSGTSIGANVTEGHYGASKADFINKYVIAEKEAGETLYWLRLLSKSAAISKILPRHNLFLPTATSLSASWLLPSRQPDQEIDNSATHTSSFILHTCSQRFDGSGNW